MRDDVSMVHYLITEFNMSIEEAKKEIWLKNIETLIEEASSFEDIKIILSKILNKL